MECVRLKQEARKEFEASREETDPLVIATMLVTGRNCVDQIKTSLMKQIGLHGNGLNETQLFF
jgi:hypothetical protein